MLRHLFIKNFTLIDTLDMDFMPGFSVITGETGAGKSIILGAIALLLGQRADPKAIKSGAERCTIEAHFDLSRYHMESFFQQNDIDYDPDDCILRRELTAQGKSRAFINDTPVPLTLMRQLGQQLVDIHSQHKNLLLQEEDFQLNVVDIIANNQKETDRYKKAFSEYQAVRKALHQLREDIEKANENEDFIRFQFNELHDADLLPGEQVELEQESETLSHVEDIKNSLFTADQLLNGEDSNPVERLREATRTLGNIRDIYPAIGELSERLESCQIELHDISRELDALTENVDFDPQRLERINDRLDTIYTLEKKHHVTSVEELIDLRDQLEQQLNHIEGSDEELQMLEDRESLLLERCYEAAAQLSAQRQKAARKIEKEMTSRLVPLGIPHVRFNINVTQKDLSPDGADKVCFLFSANTSTPMQPVSEVASGGEIARVMLSLKAMISGAVKLPTIIFDEIDTGVSGKMAERMALIMKEMGAHDRQVISITHLPQIAAQGTTHYKVLKQETPQGTTSTMIMLDQEQRVQETAQMLSGSDITEAAINNARELLQL